jgi:hypothetical protein
MVTPNEPTQELSIDEQRCSIHAVTDAGCDVGNGRGLSRAGKLEVFPSADEYKCISKSIIRSASRFSRSNRASVHDGERYSAVLWHLW